jgi:hypothetical protein
MNNSHAVPSHNWASLNRFPATFDRFLMIGRNMKMISIEYEHKNDDRILVVRGIRQVSLGPQINSLLSEIISDLDSGFCPVDHG